MVDLAYFLPTTLESRRLIFFIDCDILIPWHGSIVLFLYLHFYITLGICFVLSPEFLSNKALSGSKESRSRRFFAEHLGHLVSYCWRPNTRAVGVYPGTLPIDPALVHIRLLPSICTIKWGQ